MTRDAASCEQARLWASLDVDAELSELERARLDAHLEACPGCRRYARELADLAAQMRAAPPSEPSALVWMRQRRQTGPRRWQLALSAAAVVAALFAGGLAGRLRSAGHPGDTPGASPASAWMFYTAYHSAPETALLARRRIIPS
jgi:predicted anti-sigma-YlaC factor YlaD